MQTYLTPEEIAEQLKVEVAEILSLVEEGRLPAIRIGESIRIREADIELLMGTAPPVPLGSKVGRETDGSRWCLTRNGRAKFRVKGSIATAVEIWPGQMRYPIKFSKEFMDSMLSRFRGSEIPVGGKFDEPGHHSLGEFIQRKLKIKMNPAVYLAALLIEEGYADTSRRGYIRFRSDIRRPADAETQSTPLHTKVDNLADLFLSSPFRGLNLTFERDRDTGREISL